MARPQMQAKPRPGNRRRHSGLPFAQIATRIGGAITVTLVLIALSRLG